MLVRSDMVPMSLVDLKAKTQTEAIATITASVCGTNCHQASTSKSFHALHLEAFSIHTQARNPSLLILAGDIHYSLRFNAQTLPKTLAKPP